MVVEFLRLPLQAVFRFGPSWGDWGFMHGMTEAAYCARHRGTSARVWASSVDAMRECEDIVTRDMVSFEVATYALMSVVVLWRLVESQYTYWFIYRPVLDRLAIGERERRRPRKKAPRLRDASSPPSDASSPRSDASSPRLRHASRCYPRRSGRVKARAAE